MILVMLVILMMRMRMLATIGLLLMMMSDLLALPETVLFHLADKGHK